MFSLHILFSFHLLITFLHDFFVHKFHFKNCLLSPISSHQILFYFCLTLHVKSSCLILFLYKIYIFWGLEFFLSIHKSHAKLSSFHHLLLMKSFLFTFHGEFICILFIWLLEGYGPMIHSSCSIFSTYVYDFNLNIYKTIITFDV